MLASVSRLVSVLILSFSLIQSTCALHFPHIFDRQVPTTLSIIPFPAPANSTASQLRSTSILGKETSLAQTTPARQSQVPTSDALSVPPSTPTVAPGGGAASSLSVSAVVSVVRSPLTQSAPAPSIPPESVPPASDVATSARGSVALSQPSGVSAIPTTGAPGQSGQPVPTASFMTIAGGAGPLVSIVSPVSAGSDQTPIPGVIATLTGSCGVVYTVPGPVASIAAFPLGGVATLTDPGGTVYTISEFGPGNTALSPGGVATLTGPGGIVYTVTGAGPGITAVPTGLDGQPLVPTGTDGQPTQPTGTNGQPIGPSSTESQKSAPTIPTTGSPPYNTDLPVSARVGIGIGAAALILLLFAWGTVWCVQQRRARNSEESVQAGSQEALLTGVNEKRNVGASSQNSLQTPASSTYTWPLPQTPMSEKGGASPQLGSGGGTPAGSTFALPSTLGSREQTAPGETSRLLDSSKGLHKSRMK